MPTTTNFGWTTPADTDYVKDGALAIRTLGNGIDTSLVDLKGGTSGQYLVKNSNTDLDFTWTTNTADIDGITATSPLTGGGTSGTITVGIQDGTTAQKGAVQLEDSTSSTSTTKAATPNSVKSAYDLAGAAIAKSLIDAEGDLIVGDAADAVQRLAIGTTGQVLTVDTAVDGKIKWATPSSGTPSFVGVSVYADTNQSVSNETLTAVNFNQEQFDTDGFHSNSTNNSRITIPSGKGGKYLLTGCIWWEGGTGQRYLTIYKNGSDLAATNSLSQIAGISGKRGGVAFSQILDLTAGDYIQLYALQGSGGNLNLANDIYSGCNWQVQYLGA